MAGRRDWTYEEALLAFDLYCRLPSIPGGHSNPDKFPEVVELEQLTGRSFSAIIFKLCNFRALDLSDDKAGFRNGGSYEPRIWEEYRKSGMDLIHRAEEIKTRLRAEAGIADPVIAAEPVPPYGSIRGGERLTEVKARVGQNFFRSAVLASYKCRCCITGINQPELLIASHIKPWAASAPEEKTDPRNGLCLNSLHDAAFDQGLISFDSDYRMIISPLLEKSSVDSTTKDFIVSGKGEKLIMPDKKLFLPCNEFMEYHRDVIFKSSL